MSIARAFATGDNKRDQLFDGFGEQKRLAEWSRDARCPVSRSRLCQLVYRNGMTIERAFTFQSGKKHREYIVEAFGESKRLGEWRRDPRCPMRTWSGLYFRVVGKGMTIEQAFALGPHNPARDGQARKKTRRLPITAWDKTKNAEEWAKDPRAAASAELILTRLERGIAAEDAISLTSSELRDRRQTSANGDRRNAKHFHEAFGERKSLGAWTRDPRCPPISRWGLYFRVLRMGMTIEEAFARGEFDNTRKQNRQHRNPNKIRKKTGPKPQWPTVTAWNETKTPEEWAADSRASVNANLIVVRLKRGYSPEQAISTAKWVREPRLTIP